MVCMLSQGHSFSFVGRVGVNRSMYAFHLPPFFFLDKFWTD